ncbi:MAG: DUF1501 domain-containing protein [Acidobacteriota bacterium]
MATTRRQFIQRSATAVSLGVVMPNLFLSEALGQTADTQNSKKLVVIQMSGGNDGFNTVIPFSDSRYLALRPKLAFRESELNTAKGSMLLSGNIGLHPALTEIKDLWDAGKVAIVQGVGYPNSTLSHFLAMDVWHTADTTGLAGKGWLGKYADVALVGQAGLPAAAVAGELPKTFYAERVVIPNIISFQFYNFLTDPAYPNDARNQVNTFYQAASRNLSTSQFLGSINHTAFEALTSAQKVQAALSSYQSSVVYNSQNPLAVALQMLAQILVTMPEANLLYAAIHGFDHHADQVDHSTGQANKFAGQHHLLLRWFSEAVKSFYDDLAEHNLADKTLMMQWSEFGRRPGENASFGTDHGTTSNMFIIGDPVSGGFYGQQPSLAALELDAGGNPKHHVDFRSVYSTILNRWLGADARAILGAQYEDVGFLSQVTP